MKKLDVLTLLAACLLAVTVKCKPTELPPAARASIRSTDFTVNLRTGVTSALPVGISWHSFLKSGLSKCECDHQGVLKLNFHPTLRVRAEISMTFEKPVGFTFHVGDSVTNDGYAGDAGTQLNDAEVHSVGNGIYFYGRDNPAGGTYGLLYSATNFVAINPYTTVKLNVADQLATADNGLNYIYINSHKLFALNGQNDTDGVNYDLYFAMNRVVGTPLRNGKGLCFVSIRFYNF